MRARVDTCFVVAVVVAAVGLAPAVVEPAAAPSPAEVPAPAAIPAGVIDVPCWSCPEAREWPLRFRTDLDLLAPLGGGPENAGVWLAAFAKLGGARFAEAEAAQARRVEHPKVGKVLPADDPLLKEAEAWVDRATMHFYPDVFPVEGYATKIPNLLISITFARSWLARGLAAAEPEAAYTDFRRAIRLGRLLRQEDVTLIQDLVGVACIRLGASGIYEVASKQGNTRLALVAAIVQGEATAQRLRTELSIKAADLTPFINREQGREPVLLLPDNALEAVVAKVTKDPDRRFRNEATMSLALVRLLGTPAQKARATAALGELVKGTDAVQVATAKHALSWAPSSEELKDLLRGEAERPKP